MQPAPIHIIVRLPYNRPEAPDQQLPEPPHIVWNADKESLLWELIARSRMADNAATDWQGLSAHLGVPLPYLLYRAQARYEQDLKGLQNVGGALSSTPHVVPRALPGDEDRPRPRVLIGPPNAKPAPQTSPTRLRHSGGSSSTFTLRQRRSHVAMTPLPPKPPSPVGSDSDNDSDQAEAEEEEQRRDEQDNIALKLKELERMMSADMLGFARSPRKVTAEHPASLPASPERPAHASPTQRAENTSSSASSSVRGSIPSIPSPPSTSQAGSMHTRSKPQSRSPSTRNFRGINVPPTRHAALERTLATQKGSNHGSSASSFSDVELSDASVTASALEDALMSNIRGGGSRLSSMFARSHFAAPRGAQS